MRPSVRSSVLYLACVAALHAAPARAQDTPTFSVSITEADEVVQTIGTTRRIDRAEIEARHARTLDEALRLIPGVYVRTGGDGTPRIDVRGFRSRHVLLLVDGVPFNSAADGQFDPARISTAAIREITVTFGTSSVLYGDNAMAAVIEIVTTPEKSAAALDLTAGAPDQRDAAGRIARSIGRLDLMIAGSAFTTPGYRLASSFTPTTVENGGRRENSDRDRRDLRANLGYAVSPSLKLATEWTVASGAYGTPPSTIDNPADIFAQPVRYDRINDYRTVSGQVSVAFVPAKALDVRAWAYRNQQREDAARYDSATYSSIDKPLVSGTFRSRDRTVVSGASALARIDLGRGGWLRLAVNQRREAFASSGVIRDVLVSGAGSGTGAGGGAGRGARQQPAVATYALRSFDTDQHTDVYSAGTEWEFHPIARLGVAMGGAINWQGRVDAATDAEPTWIAGLSYDLTQTVRLHASASHKIRFPSVDQLYDESAGNPLLQPEQAYAVDAGVDRQLGAASRAGLSIYSTGADNFIERNQGAIFVNRDRYRFSGAEVEFETRLIPRLDLRTAYTFLDSTELGGGNGAELQYRPRHRATLEAEWRLPSQFSARAAVYGVADQRYYSRGTTPIAARAGDYTVVDASVTRRFTRQLDLVFGVTNLFDALYEQAYGLPREGRAAFLTLRTRFE